jgi:hypothetical protein
MFIARILIFFNHINDTHKHRIIDNHSSFQKSSLMADFFHPLEAITLLVQSLAWDCDS